MPPKSVRLPRRKPGVQSRSRKSLKQLILPPRSPTDRTRSMLPARKLANEWLGKMDQRIRDYLHLNPKATSINVVTCSYVQRPVYQQNEFSRRDQAHYAKRYGGKRGILMGPGPIGSPKWIRIHGYATPEEAEIAEAKFEREKEAANIMVNYLNRRGFEAEVVAETPPFRIDGLTWSMQIMLNRKSIPKEYRDAIGLK